MSAFEALRLIRAQQRSFPHLNFQSACNLLCRMSASSCGLDYEGAKFLDPLIPRKGVDCDLTEFYRACVESILVQQRPTWVRMIAYGRGKFIEKLAPDEVQCFRTAGLLESPPSVEVIAWWDKIAGLGRKLGEEAKMIQARIAERLSFEFEQLRIEQLRVGSPPIWISIEDNQAGYDIHSFDVGDSGPVARLIEVKSTSADLPRIFISRNEWEQALVFGPSYIFHVWDMRSSKPSLHQFSSEKLAVHIPSNRGDGSWSNVEILLEELL